MEIKVLMETSARHIHLTDEAIEILFGKGHTLTKKKDLSQPGQFACEERVTVVGSKKELAGVSILGPARSAGACKIIGPCGEIEISEGVIAAKRHIHLDTKTAEEFGLSDKQVVSVKVDSEGRKTVFGDVVVRVSDKYAPAMHIDTDESNACAAAPGMTVTILK